MDKELDGNYKLRKHAIIRCFKLATKKGMRVFAVQDGGWCAASKSMTDYKKYGKSDRCKDGKGGAWANSVYRIIRG